MTLFVRQRPFIDEEYLSELLNMRPTSLEGATGRDDLLAFTSGRGALKWLLSRLTSIKRCPLRIGLQAFTCRVVLQAVLESGNKPVFFDIDYSFFSTPLSYIDFDSIDVLILTHLFGIPNPAYLGIIEECRRQGILVIDDVAQTLHAFAGNREVGSLSDFSFSSFGFDKPASSFGGSHLRVGARDTELAEQLREDYSQLAVEPYRHQRADLQLLLIYYRLTDPAFFHDAIRYNGAITHWLMRVVYGWSRQSWRQLAALHDSRFVRIGERLQVKIGRTLGSNSIPVRRMGELRSLYLGRSLSLLPKFEADRQAVATLAENQFKKVFPDASFPTITHRTTAKLYRLPVLVPKDKRRGIIKRCHAAGIQIGAYNWPELCFDRYGCFADIQDSFPVSRSVSERILNLPIWTPKVWEHFA